MKELNNNELVLVIGGGINSAFVNALTKAAGFVYNLGQSVGSSIRRISGGNYCPM